MKIAQAKIVLVACGTGIATSTVIASKIRELAEPLGVTVDVRQIKVAEAVGLADEADLIVATTEVPSRITIPVINAIPLLTGLGAQQVLDQIAAALTAAPVQRSK